MKLVPLLACIGRPHYGNQWGDWEYLILRPDTNTWLTAVRP